MKLTKPVQETNLHFTTDWRSKHWKLDNRTSYQANIFPPWGAVHWAAHGEFCRGRLPLRIIWELSLTITFHSVDKLTHLQIFASLWQFGQAYFRSQPIADGSLTALGWETRRERGKTLTPNGGRLSSHDPSLSIMIHAWFYDIIILYMIVWLYFYYQFPWYYYYSCILLPHV